MRIVIFGTGAMACLFAARLSRVAQVILVGTWAEAIRSIRERGILIEDGLKSQMIQVRAEYLGEQLPPAKLAIVLVKSWQTKNIAKYIPRYLGAEGLILSLQNGLGNLKLLGEQAVPGATLEGATVLGPGHIRYGGTGPIHVVAPDWVVDTFNRAGFDSHGCSPGEADSLLWGKLTISCGINALTAILRVPNGELLKIPPAADLMAKAAVECARVAHACGVKLPFDDAARRVKEVAERTASNKSSMLQDVLRGAPTECDAINGAVVREGNRLKVSTPVNDILCRLVKAMIHRNGSDR
jgi:2-dehydropantoate 2-reductase